MRYSKPEDFANLTLKEHSETVEIDTSDECRLASLSMARQAARSIDIVSRHLDPLVYDNREFEEALSDLVVGSNRAKVRILVLQPDALVKQGHRLLTLTQRLSSYMDMRVPAREHKDYNAAFMVVDEIGSIYRSHADRYEGLVRFNDRAAAMELERQFEEMWTGAVADANLRRTYL